MASALPPALSVASVFDPHDPLEGPLGLMVLGLLVWVSWWQRLGHRMQNQTPIQTWTRTGRRWSETPPRPRATSPTTVLRLALVTRRA